MTFHDKFRSYLKTLFIQEVQKLKDTGMTYGQIADKIKLHPTYLSQYLHNRENPTMESLLNMLELLGNQITMHEFDRSLTITVFKTH